VVLADHDQRLRPCGGAVFIGGAGCGSGGGGAEGLVMFFSGCPGIGSPVA